MLSEVDYKDLLEELARRKPDKKRVDWSGSLKGIPVSAVVSELRRREDRREVDVTIGELMECFRKLISIEDSAIVIETGVDFTEADEGMAVRHLLDKAVTDGLLEVSKESAPYRGYTQKEYRPTKKWFHRRD